MPENNCNAAKTNLSPAESDKTTETLGGICDETRTGNESKAVRSLLSRLPNAFLCLLAMLLLDVFIVGYPKTGVHVTGQMAHIVRARGQGTAEISDLSQVTPFIYMLDSHNIPYDANQPHNPRIFLSHDVKDLLPSGGKYIYILRDPLDVFNAFVPFMRSLMKFQMAESVLFCIWIFGTRYSAIPGTDYFTHVSKWWEHRDDPNVMFVSYDDVVYNKPQAEKKLADFMGIEIDDKQLQEIQQVSKIQSNHKYMVENDDKFNSLVISRVWNEKFGFPPRLLPFLICNENIVLVCGCPR